MVINFDKCIPMIEKAYYLLERAEVDPKIHRALATSLFIYALQSGPKQGERVLEIIKSVLPDEEITEISEDRDFEVGDYYLLLPLSFALRALESNKSDELIDGINLLIDAANCLNGEKTYDLHLSKKDPLKDDALFLELLKTFLKINQELFTDEVDDLQPEEIVEIAKALGLENSLTYITVFKHALRVAESIQQDERISPDEKSDLFIMALKTLLTSEENLKLAIVFAKTRQYDFAAKY